MYRWASIAKYPDVQNFFCFPGLSVPIGFDSVSGLPMAMQITTLTGEQALGFRIEHTYERVTPEIQMNQPAL
jgi:Asp-tRNA(Asn)/Glu-tRNA(Gln) amidotransferase A subunit family amidase